MSALLQKLQRFLPASAGKRNVLVLFSGTLAAQAISILVSPILTRLYLPAQFGVFASFMAITTILVEISAAKYEMAIILPEKDEDGLALVRLAIVIVSGFSLLTLVLLLLFHNQLIEKMRTPGLELWLFAIPVMVFLTGWYNALNYWNNRKKQYKRMASNRPARGIFTSATNVGLGLGVPQINGLILGGIAGQAFTTALFFKQAQTEEKSLFGKLNFEPIKALAWRYKDFPRFLLPSALVETTATQVPLILLGTYFGSAVLGFFSLAVRVVAVPMSLIGNSVRDVFRQSASETYAKTGNCRELFLKAARSLFRLSALPFLLLYFISPALFGMVFGDSWRESGEYARIMVVMFFCQFISSPLSSMFLIAEKQKWDLVIQSICCVSVISSIVIISREFKEPKLAILAYSLIYSIKAIVEFIISYRLTIKPNAHVQEALV